MSTVRKGNYYRLRTKHWLKDKGWWVENLEKSMRITATDKTTGQPKVIFIKQDLAGADLLAMNKKDILFVQVKTNPKHISDAMKEFAKFPFPPFVKRWVVHWPERSQEPEITEIADGDV